MLKAKLSISGLLPRTNFTPLLVSTVVRLQFLLRMPEIFEEPSSHRDGINTKKTLHLGSIWAFNKLLRQQNHQSDYKNNKH